MARTKVEAPKRRGPGRPPKAEAKSIPAEKPRKGLKAKTKPAKKAEKRKA